MSVPEAVTYECRGNGVAVLTLSRPERMNAWGGGMAAAFYSHLDTAEADPAVRAIVLTQALMCDVRFAAAGAKFTTSFARRGLIAEYGISWILPRVVGWSAALDLLLSGRVFYADEAADLGLVKEVIAAEDLLPRAIAYAEDIAANCAPSSLAVIKQQMYEDTMRDVYEASDLAEKLMHASMLRPDFIEGITAFFEKRPPNFPPLKGQEQ